MCCNHSISIHASAREATLHPFVAPARDFYFNPRLREGGDCDKTGKVLITTISIHASAREATVSGKLILARCGISIHASAREATHLYISPFVLTEFQSTPPRGRRLTSLCRTCEGFLFQSTPPRGRRRFSPPWCLALVDFNPRLREGGDAG